MDRNKQLRVYLLDPRTGVFSQLKIGESEIRDFIEDADGSVLIATKGGVFRSSLYALSDSG